MYGSSESAGHCLSFGPTFNLQTIFQVEKSQFEISPKWAKYAEMDSSYEIQLVGLKKIEHPPQMTYAPQICFCGKNNMCFKSLGRNGIWRHLLCEQKRLE